METPVLTVGDLVLEPPRVDDAEDWSEAQDEECARWFDWPAPPGVDRCRAHLERVTGEPEADEYVWAIRDGGAFAGGFELKRLDDRWNVSYFVHPAHRGRGIATETVRRVCRWAFDDLGLAEIGTPVHVGNTASRRVLERAGFVHVGRRPSETGDHEDDFFLLVFTSRT